MFYVTIMLYVRHYPEMKEIMLLISPIYILMQFPGGGHKYSRNT
jgi:hypothetical protein